MRGLAITRPNPVLAMDITYIPMARGFVYLAAVVDWFSRRVLSWRLLITMEANFCIEARDEAIQKHGRLEIFNTDQGSQFTSEVFTGQLNKEGIQISMDSKGRCRNNVFVERLYKSIKYEGVYLCAYSSVAEARQSLGRYLDFYNSRRPTFEPEGANTRSGILQPPARNPGSLKAKARASTSNLIFIFRKCYKPPFFRPTSVVPAHSRPETARE